MSVQQVLVTPTYLENIADAIRGRNGTQNTYTPAQMAAAVTAIPNSYAAGDEGKVVDNGALVSQSSLSVTENGTYDTTKKNSVTVNVSGGGGTSYFSRLTPLHQDIHNGYIAGGTWDTSSSASTDVYLLEANKVYLIMLGNTIGNRFRTAVFAEDISLASSNVTGVAIMGNDSPTAYAVEARDNEVYKTSKNPSYLYLGIQKTNQNVTGIETFVFEVLF